MSVLSISVPPMSNLVFVSWQTLNYLLNLRMNEMKQIKFEGKIMTVFLHLDESSSEAEHMSNTFLFYFLFYFFFEVKTSPEFYF